MLTPKDTAFHVALREHLVDEGRHQIFFQMLMRHICQEIDEPTRLALGRLLPGFLDALILDRDSWRGFDLPILARPGLRPAALPDDSRRPYRPAYGHHNPPPYLLFPITTLLHL